MSKRYQERNSTNEQSQEGVIAGEELGAEHVEQSPAEVEQIVEAEEGADTPAEPDAPVEPEEQSAEPEAKATFGIGQFVRHLLKNTSKTNAEILELTLKTFDGSKTTAACIAWYKTDMRKKGLLTGGTQRGRVKTVELSAEQLAELAK